MVLFFFFLFFPFFTSCFSSKASGRVYNIHIKYQVSNYFKRKRRDFKSTRVSRHKYFGSLDNENGNPMTIPKNLPLHFKWALAAAKQGHVRGQSYTAECYEKGWGVEQNEDSAFEWYLKAAEQKMYLHNFH